MFRRLKRKILPRKAGKRISNFLWRTGGATLMIGGAACLLWGGFLFLKTRQASVNLPGPAVDQGKNISFIILGLGAGGLGYALYRIYQFNRGQIDSRFLKDKDSKKKNG